MTLRRIKHKEELETRAEWDALAPIRKYQIENGIDVTYHHVLIPGILELIPAEAHQVIDAGCGIGVLTDILARRYRTVVGVNPSSESISIARGSNGQRATYIATTLEEFSLNLEERADVVVANMVLMDVLDLDAFLVGVERSLRPGGHFIFASTHPWFWPRYYGYADEPWFKYTEAAIIEGPFKISGAQENKLVSTHVHRPLETVVKALAANGLLIETLIEPMPPAHVERLYPAPWQTPRYLLGRCRCI